MAMQVAIPVPDGVNRPEEVIVPPVAIHVTALLYDPVPATIAVHCEVCAVVIELGAAATVTEVTVNGALATAMVAEPEMFVYPDCVEVATQLPVPVPDGVKRPDCVIEPPVAVQVTALLYAPVPVTVATHCEVCPVLIEAGAAATVILVTVGAVFVTVMAADPEMFVNPACVEFAVQLPVPMPEGVNTPDCVMVPPVAVHITALLYPPVPATVATHCAVCPMLIEPGDTATVTEVTVIGVCTAAMAIDAEPDTFVDPVCIEVAMHVPVPTPDGVKRPD